jgi:hypothetical protein
MTAHSGQFYTLAAGVQSAKGTPQATPAFKLRITGGAVLPDPTVIDLPETDGSIQRSKSAKVGQAISGAIEGMWRSDEIGWLARAHLGTSGDSGAGPYTHTATAATQLPYLTLFSAYDTTALVDRYSDCRLTELTLRGQGQQALSYSAGFMGLIALMGSTDPVLTPSANDPLVYPHVTVTLGGATTDIVEAFEVTSSRAMEVIYGDTGMAASDVAGGRWGVTGQLTILFESDAKHRAWLTNNTSGTATSPVLYTEALTILAEASATDDSVSMAMTAVELRKVGMEPDPSGGALRFTYEFSAEPQATIANTFSIVTKNNVTTYA